MLTAKSTNLLDQSDTRADAPGRLGLGYSYFYFYFGGTLPERGSYPPGS